MKAIELKFLKHIPTTILGENTMNYEQKIRHYLELMKTHFNSEGIHSDYISPERVQDAAVHHFPFMKLDSEEIVWLSDQL